MSYCGTIISQRHLCHRLAHDNLDSIAKLIEDKSGSLQREMADFRADVAQFRAEVNERFDGLETAIKRHDAGVLAAKIAVTGITRAQARTEQQVRDLASRVRKLERRQPRS